MQIDSTTLVTVATPLLARIEARRAQQLDYSDCAYEALGMLRAFVQGYLDEEAEQRRHDED